MKNIDPDKLKKGKEFEGKILKYFKGKGWDAKLNIFYDEDGNETYQSILLDSGYSSYPDIEIQKEKDGITVRHLVEVKSLKRLFINGLFNVVVRAEQFEDYKEVQRFTKIPVHIAFIFYEEPFDIMEEWYMQSLDKLDVTKKLVKDLYQSEDRHYIWQTTHLKRIK